MILSTGIGTFSRTVGRTTFADVLTRAEQAKAPVYVFNLGELARRRLSSASGGCCRVSTGLRVSGSSRIWEFSCPRRHPRADRNRALGAAVVSSSAFVDCFEGYRNGFRGGSEHSRFVAC